MSLLLPHIKVPPGATSRSSFNLDTIFPTQHLHPSPFTTNSVLPSSSFHSSTSTMHFKHRVTPEDTSTFVQKLVESSPIPASSNQAKLVGQGAGFLHRKLSEKAKHHSESWQAKIEETAKRHVEKHVPYPHSPASTTEMLAASSAAAGFAHHASTFPIEKDDQHAYNAPTSRKELSEDQPQAAFSENDQPNANLGPQASGVVTANEAQDGHNSRTVAGELAAESLAFVPHGDSRSSNFAPRTDPSHLSIRAVWESGAIWAKRGARLLNRLLKRAPVHKSEVGYERILKIS
jgi:hypothetical protein